MFKAPLSLKDCRVLVSNDDGIGAPGIKKLIRIANNLAKEVWVVAPLREQSAAAHSLTIRLPLRINKISRNSFSVNGTPTDCIKLAINQIMQKHPPDLILSGINRGVNVGEDITYSGTVAAAMESTLLGIPAIALSQGVEDHVVGDKVDWSPAEVYAAKIIKKVTSISWPSGVLINVNFPPVPNKEVSGIEITHEGRRELWDEIIECNDPKGEPYYWIGAQRHSGDYSPGTDLAAIQSGRISITPLSVGLTHKMMITKLGKAFRN